MSRVSSPQTTQLITGAQARVAGGDYVEAPWPSSIEMLMATSDADQLDEMTRQSEYLFGRRFGFVAGQRARARVVAIARQLDLSDREVRWLKRSGSLQVRHDGAQLSPSTAGLVAGSYHLAVLTLFGLSGAVLIMASSRAPWMQLIGLASLSLVCLGLGWLNWALHIQPWRISKRYVTEILRAK